MLRKSLRVRIVFTFTLIVIVSLSLSFVITSLISQRRPDFKEQLPAVSADIASIINHADSGQRDKLVKLFSKYHVDIEAVQAGGAVPFGLTEEQVRPLFLPKAASPLLLKRDKGTIQIVGVPSFDDEGNAMVLRVNFTNVFYIMNQVLFIGLFIVLVIGSLLILLASRYIVEPVKRLTRAAEEMATGNLAIRLEHKQKDEFGELMDSFNHMVSELQKIDKMREDFVGNVSHEIQSPITSIRGFTAAIRDGLVPQDQQKEHMDIIYQETVRLSKLSEHLLRLASLDSDQHPVHRTEYRLDEQLRRVILLQEPLWTASKLELRLALQPCVVKLDADLFAQVWQNLLSNAIKHSMEGAVIEVDIEVKKETVLVHMKDEGQGIPAEDLPRIFDRFYRVDKSRNRSEGGNGLGLSIVKKIVELHGCKITVVSEDGKGSRFTVSIPLKVG
ncbi:ATP-binding protein [Paenibacillus sp. FSL R10-2782]|uniref:sensor histidine kinase n=1 Tax=Paenibacillus sp. FSL R10-2782 TaxID=2954661 RepID=UPI0031584441